MAVLSKRAVAKRAVAKRAVAIGAVGLGLVIGLVGLAAGQTTEQAARPSATQADGGKVLATGPGYSIVATSPQKPGARGAAAAETTVTDAPLETLRDPIVCQGERVLRIDNRDIRFDGDAITAEDGCEIHITNSRISAGGIAIRARNASVHIENSEIVGSKASIDAAGAAQIYAEASTFKGAARRVGQAAIHDLGNNDWL